jgi:hypothetical protein
MRKIDLRISDARKKLADSIYKKQAVEIDRQYAHVKLNHFNFHLMQADDKATFFRIHAQWIKAKVRARLATYLDAFRDENVIPDALDLSNMSWAFKDAIDTVTLSLPEELKGSLNQLGREQVIEDARRDIEIFAQKMSIEQMRAETRQQQSNSIHYNTHIYGDNRGNVQQGGENNTQATNPEKEVK